MHRHGVTKAEKGHFDKAGVTGKRFVREFKFENADEYQLAQEIKADIFEAGDKVDATAISTRVKYSRAKRCQDTWEQRRLQFRTLKS